VSEKYDTVEETIQKLKQYDPKLKVVMCADGVFWNINSIVEISKDNPGNFCLSDADPDHLIVLSEWPDEDKPE
jgi:hypothetical protein